MFSSSSNTNSTGNNNSNSNQSSNYWGYSSQISAVAALWQDDDDDDSENPFGKSEENEKDCTLFVIDCNESMLDANMFQQSCSAITEALKRKIIQSSDDRICVILFNTRETRNALNKPYILIYCAPDIPSAKLIKNVRQLAINTEDNFEQQIGSLKDGKQCDFRDLLWVVQTIFTEVDVSGTKFGSKRAFIFTNRDSPAMSDQTSTLSKARDMLESGIEISVFPLAETHSFDVTRFYCKICSLSADEITNNTALLKLCPTLQDLQDGLRVKELKKRSLMSCALQLGREFAIAVKMFTLARRATKGSAVFLDARTNEPLESRTRWVCKDTGELLQDFQIKTHYEYGPSKEKVFFSKSEVRDLKIFGDPSLVLMGFKPMARLKKYYQYKPSYFVYPDEQRIEGSICCFSALMQSMHELDQFAVARFIYRKASGPRFVALLPQIELNDEDGHQVRPPGMNVIVLPFADDIRKVELDEERDSCTNLESEPLIDRAKQVIETLTLDELPCPSNPVLQQHYDALEALALEEDELQEHKDDEMDGSFVPNAEKDEIAMRDEAMISAASQEITEFVQELSNFADTYALANSAVNVNGSHKRRMNHAQGQPLTKPKARKVKKAQAISDAAQYDWPTIQRNDELKNLKVADLKKYLSANGLKMSGRKAMLIERIEQHLLSSQNS